MTFASSSPSVLVPPFLLLIVRCDHVAILKTLCNASQGWYCEVAPFMVLTMSVGVDSGLMQVHVEAHNTNRDGVVDIFGGGLDGVSFHVMPRTLEQR